MKELFYGSVITLGTAISALMGGFDAAVQTLTVCMVLDYVTGMMVAGIFKKSRKTRSGGLESRAGWKGLIRKGMELAIVIVGRQIDLAMKTTYVRDAVCIGFTVNEMISILENAGLMGVPVPRALAKAVDLLSSGSEDGEAANGPAITKKREGGD